MKLIDSFSQLYDKSVTTYVSSFNNVCQVDEHGASATFHNLYIHNHSATFYLFDTKLIQDHKDTTEKMSSVIKNSTCDGVALVYGADKSEHLIFAELKSNYSAGRLQDAFEQLIYSLLKYHRLFSLCKDYDLETLTLDFVLACHAPNKALESEAFLDEMSEQNVNGTEDLGCSFVKDILPAIQISRSKSFKFSLGQLQKISFFPLNVKLMNKCVTLHLVMSARPTDDHATINFNY